MYTQAAEPHEGTGTHRAPAQFHISTDLPSVFDHPAHAVVSRTRGCLAARTDWLAAQLPDLARSPVAAVKLEPFQKENNGKNVDGRNLQHLRTSLELAQL